MTNRLIASVERLTFAAFCRENTMGGPCRLLDVKAELAAASNEADEALKEYKSIERTQLTAADMTNLRALLEFSKDTRIGTNAKWVARADELYAKLGVMRSELDAEGTKE